MTMSEEATCNHGENAQKVWHGGRWMTLEESDRLLAEEGEFDWPDEMSMVDPITGDVFIEPTQEGHSYTPWAFNLALMATFGRRMARRMFDHLCPDAEPHFRQRTLGEVGEFRAAYGRGALRAYYRQMQRRPTVPGLGHSRRPRGKGPKAWRT